MDNGVNLPAEYNLTVYLFSHIARTYGIKLCLYPKERDLIFMRISIRRLRWVFLALYVAVIVTLVCSIWGQVVSEISPCRK